VSRSGKRGIQASSHSLVPCADFITCGLNEGPKIKGLNLTEDSDDCEQRPEHDQTTLVSEDLALAGGAAKHFYIIQGSMSIFVRRQFT
jgi:hypothetical protein